MREAVILLKLPTLLQIWRDGYAFNQLSVVFMLPGINTIRCGHVTEGKKNADFRLELKKMCFAVVTREKDNYWEQAWKKYNSVQ